MYRTISTIALFSCLAFAPAFAQEPATDATTSMDRASGNLETQPDKTLSDAEVRRLQEEAAASRMMAPATAGVPAGETIVPAAPRGQTTTTYDQRMDITAPEAGGPDH